MDGARGFLGQDTTARPEVCAVVAPAGLPDVDLDAAVAELVTRVVGAHGTLSGYVASGPSAAAFARLSFDEEANGGRFASRAGNQGTRDEEARRWGEAALRQLHAQLAAAEWQEGLDLLGGIAQCAHDLDTGSRTPTVAVVSTGVHRTVDVDLGHAVPGDVEALASDIADALPAPLRLELYGIGRIDPATTSGPVARSVTAAVTTVWAGVCDALHHRCTTKATGG
ncbi:MAG: hypothetical protein AB7Q27_27040 [Acidimicrobiia bacterium]